MWLNEKTPYLKSIEATAFMEHDDLKVWVAIEAVENQYHTVETLQMWTQSLSSVNRNNIDMFQEGKS